MARYWQIPAYLNRGPRLFTGSSEAGLGAPDVA